MHDGKRSSSTMVTVHVNGKPVQMPQGAMLAAALLNAGVPCRISESGEPRSALCGMGICFECRASVDGTPHQRTCQIVCHEGMTVETQR
jgi:sarcosine oxidase subunit alpha